MATPNNGPELSEKDFINEGYSKNPFPLWLWLFLLTIGMALLWGVGNWYTDKINIVFKESPFLQVTNRDLSLFLWQNPEYMRINTKEKSNYLPAFQYLDKVTIDLAYADQYAVAPPDLLFRYHAWNRLIKNEFTDRPILLNDFRDFIGYAEEWQPAYWPGAPKEYISLIEGLPSSQVQDLSSLPRTELPLSVRIAFQGWENYFKAGEAINQIEVTQKELQEFLSSHPHYARNYWQNIVQDNVPNYLKSAETGTQLSRDVVPANEFSSFLKAALYNYLQGSKPATQDKPQDQDQDTQDKTSTPIQTTQTQTQ